MIARSVLSFISEAFHSVPVSRRRKNLAAANIQSCDILEFRRMLSGTNTAPQLENVVSLNGTIDAIVVDPNYSDMVTIEVDVDGDSNYELVTSAMVGDEISLDISYSIPPNTTASVVVHLTETPPELAAETILVPPGGGLGGASSPGGTSASSGLGATSGGQAGESSTYTFEVAGIVLEEVGITSVFVSDGITYGTINPGDLNPNATAEVLWRVVGDTTWNSGGSIDAFGNFSFGVSGSEGVTHEFIVVQRYGQFEVYGEATSAVSNGGSSTAAPASNSSNESESGEDSESDSGSNESSTSNDVYYNSYAEGDDEDEFWEMYV